MARTVLVPASTAQPVEAKTPGKKQVTIVQPEVSARRVDKFQHHNAVRDSRTLDLSDKVILYTLATHAKQQGHDVRPGLDLLAAETTISVATLKRRIPNLVRRGYLIQVTSGKGGNSKYASLYHLALPVDLTVEVNSSPGEPLAIESNSSSESFNSSSESFNSSPDELTTSKENIPKNIPNNSVGRSPSGKTGPSAQDSGIGDSPSVDSPSDPDPEPEPMNDRSVWDDLSPDEKRDLVLGFAGKRARSGLYASDIVMILRLPLDCSPDIRAFLDSLVSDGLFQPQGPFYSLTHAA